MVVWRRTSKERPVGPWGEGGMRNRVIELLALADGLKVEISLRDAEADFHKYPLSWTFSDVHVEGIAGTF